MTSKLGQVIQPKTSFHETLVSKMASTLSLQEQQTSRELLLNSEMPSSTHLQAPPAQSANPKEKAAIVLSEVLQKRDKNSCLERFQLKKSEKVISDVYYLCFTPLTNFSNVQDEIRQCVDLDGDSDTYTVSTTGNKITCVAHLKTKRDVEYFLHVIGTDDKNTYSGEVMEEEIRFSFAFGERYINAFITERDPVQHFTLKQKECTFEHEKVKIFFPEGAHIGSPKDIKIRIQESDIEDLMNRQREEQEFVFESISDLVLVNYDGKLQKPVQIQMCMKKMPVPFEQEVKSVIVFYFDGDSYNVMENVVAEKVDSDEYRISVNHFSGFQMATSQFTLAEFLEKFDVDFFFGGKFTWRILTFVGKGVPNTLMLRVEVVKDYLVKKKVKKRSEESLTEPKYTRSSSIKLDSDCKLYITMGQNCALKVCQNTPNKIIMDFMKDAVENYQTFPVEKTLFTGKPVNAVVEVSLDTGVCLHRAYFDSEPFFRGKQNPEPFFRGKQNCEPSFPGKQAMPLKRPYSVYLASRPSNYGNRRVKENQKVEQHRDNGNRRVKENQKVEQHRDVLSIRSLGILASHISMTASALFATQLNIPYDTYQNVKSSLQPQFTEVNIKILNLWLEQSMADRERNKKELVIALKNADQKHLAERVQRAIEENRELIADDFPPS